MIGAKLADRYEILAELGRGGMGVVYRAKDPVLNREVAIKLIPPGNLTKDAEERFQREAQIVAQMDHPGIVPIHDLGRDEGALFFVMPVLPGTNLRSLLREGSLRLGDVLDVGTQVAEALDYSHARGIVHRDIKPENIMTSRDDAGHVRARVMDFGLALASTEDRLTKTGTLVGTVAYFSPEQVTSRSFDGRTDTYALGTVLYECLAGEPPFSGEVQSVLYRIVHELPQSMRTLGADVSEELQSIIFQCLEKDPEKRPKRAGHLAEELRRYRGKLHEDEYTRSVMLTASRMVSRPQAAASPFIGREKEIAELQRRLHAAVAGECQFAVVAGEPGIGKSRLIEQLTSLARARKIRVLQGRFVEQDRAFAHQGFCELIQDYFRSKDAGSSGTSRPDFSDLAGDLLALFPVLSEVGELRSAAMDSGPTRAAKAEDKTAVFELIARTLTRIGHGKPLVLVLEELHGAELSIEALQYISRRLGPTPTLIVGTYRQTEVEKRHPLVKMLESFRGDARFMSITLGPLSVSEHRSLVELAGGGGKVSDSLATRLYEATEGNPLFTKELVRSLLDSGSIAKDDTGAMDLSGAAGLSSDVLPETIQQAVAGRIERLPEEPRDVLSIASVLGKSFEFRDLETLAEGVGGLDEAIERLVRDGLLEEEPGSRGDRLAFASGIVRDVLYNAVARRKRKLLHRRYAELLEKRQAGRLERVYPDLLHHFSEGDVPEKAVEYGLKLAQKSLAAFSPEEAARVARTVLDYVEGAEWSGEEAPEGEARLLLAQASHMGGHLDAALRESEAAVKSFERRKKPGRAVAAMLFAAEAAWQARRVDEARRWAERGLEAARAEDETDPLARLLSLAATVASMRGEHKKAATYLAEIERLSPKGREAEEAAEGGTLLVALANPVTSIDPPAARTIEEQEVLSTVFETLVTTDPQGNLVPLLCESWRVQGDGKTVSLGLRRGVRFSDGSPVTASAVKASFERAMRLRREELPAAFAAIRGVTEFLSGAAAGAAGIEVRSEEAIDIHLQEPLPIFPALLTETAAAVVKPAEGDGSAGLGLGTGPFRIARHAPDRVVLEKSAHTWRQPPPHLDGVDFRASMSASAIAAGIRDGRVELARDLLPHDLDELLREPRFRSGLIETPKKGTYFVLFNCGSGSQLGSNPTLRRALAGVTRSQDFVWGALGRFALPATGLLPPGILGHDAGRRRALLPREAAQDLLREAGLTLPIRLKAAVHPILQDRFRALTSALFGVWRELGVEVSVVTATMTDYLEGQKHPTADILVGRWIADYDDPDDFTFGLFHSKNGHWKAFYSTEEADRILEEARVESRAAHREALYRKFEQLLLEEAALIPLFHEIDYRLAAPSVRGVVLSSTPPFVSYGDISKIRAERAPRPVLGGGAITVPIPGAVNTLDPSQADSYEDAEAVGNVFETLTRNIEGGKIVPWLASEIDAEEGGTRFRFRLRRGVRFHDGRMLTARDVRYSFERTLQNVKSQSRWLLSPIRGASEILNGKSSELAGLKIVSPSELVLELEKPVSFFPAMLSYVGLSVLPEGTSRLGDHWSQGCAGTGPFRVVRFEPGRLLETERNPGYWREGFPKAESLAFRFGVSPEEIKREFLAGRLSVASDLLPADADELRHDARFASGYRESPRLSTYFVALRIGRGPLADVAIRRRIYGWNRRSGARPADARQACHPRERADPARTPRVHGQAGEARPPRLVLRAEIRSSSPPPSTPSSSANTRHSRRNSRARSTTLVSRSVP